MIESVNAYICNFGFHVHYGFLQSKLWGIQGNMKGDGFQTGGTFIVNAGE